MYTGVGVTGSIVCTLVLMLQDPRHAEDQQPVHTAGADEGDDWTAEEGQGLGHEEGGEAGGGDGRRHEETPGGGR